MPFVILKRLQRGFTVGNTVASGSLDSSMRYIIHYSMIFTAQKIFKFITATFCLTVGDSAISVSICFLFQ